MSDLLQMPERLTDKLAALLMERIESGDIAPDERLSEIGWKVTNNLYMLVLERDILNRLNGA